MDYAEITLKVPTELKYQLVYRRERGEPFAEEPADGLLFSLAAGPGWAWRQRRPLAAALGLVGLMKALLKLCTKNRLFYSVLKQGQVTATGWCSVSFCRHYKVEPGSVVIGPIWTAEKLRGQGIATFALQQALNALMQRGHRIFYIDTSGDNLASQKVIAKCGFGPPVALYIR